MSTTSVQFRLKRRDTAGWANIPDLANGEPGFETNTGRLKIGNGTDGWAQLPYVSNVRTGTAEALSGVVLGSGELGYATNSNIMKIGNNSDTFATLPTFIDLATVTAAETSATAAASSAVSAAQSAVRAQNTLAGAIITGTTAVADTAALGNVALGAGASGTGNYFTVRPVTGSGVTRFTVYKKTAAGATGQTEVGSVASGTEFDQLNTDYTRVGGNLINNSIFALDTADTGAFTTPTGYTYAGGFGGGKIVTRPNTDIESTKALQFSFGATDVGALNINNPVTQIRLRQAVTIPTQLRTTGSTNRLIYNVQHNASGSTTLEIGSNCVFTANITSAVGDGSKITYNFAQAVGFVAGSTGTILACETLPAGGTGAALTYSTQTAISVAADKLSFSVPITGVNGNVGAGSARFVSPTVGTQTSAVPYSSSSTSWQTVAIDTTIPAGFTSFEPIISHKNTVSSSAVIWITGICSVFNRPTLFRYDKNSTEQITTLATSVASGAINTANTAAANVATVANNEVIVSPWNIGTNLAPNPLLDADAIDTATPTGYTAHGTFTASVQTSPITPFNTAKAWRITHSNDGSALSDGQLGISVSVPAALRDIGFKVRYIYYTNVVDNRITRELLAFRSAYNGNTTGVTISKISTDGAINTWYPVVHEVTFTASAATNSVYLVIRQRGGVSGSGWGGSPATAFSYVSGVCFGFNRTNVVFDRSLNSELTAIANTAATTAAANIIAGRDSLNEYDQYLDSNGVMSPIIPIEQIVAWGDNLTSGGYISTVVTSLNSGGSSRSGLNHGIPSETSAQILNRIYGYNYSGPTGGNYPASAITLRARRTQPPSLIDSTQLANWTSYGLRIAEPKSVNFYVNNTLIGTSYTRLSADSTVTSGNPTLGATGHPFVDGDIVHFLTNNSVTGATGATGTNIFRGKHYFVRDRATDTYRISETSGGAAITFGATGTVAALGDFTLAWTPAAVGPYSAITTTTYTDKDTSTAVLWMGANDITADPSSVTTVQTNIRSAVSHFKTLDKRVVILTPIIAIGSGTITVTEAASPYDSTSEIVVNRNTLGTWILNTYPNNSIDIWAQLRGSITAGVNANDDLDVSRGGIPRSLRTNEINLNTAGNNIVADRVYNLLNTNKW